MSISTRVCCVWNQESIWNDSEVSPSQTDRWSPNWKAEFISFDTNIAPIKRRKTPFNSTFNFQGRGNKAYRRSSHTNSDYVIVITLRLTFIISIRSIQSFSSFCFFFLLFFMSTGPFGRGEIVMNGECCWVVEKNSSHWIYISSYVTISRFILITNNYISAPYSVLHF